MNKLKLITFDANGTLLKLKYPVGQIYSSVAKNYGFSFDPIKVENGFKLAWKNMSESHPNFGRNTIEWKSWWRNIVVKSFSGLQSGDNHCENDLELVADKLIDIFSTDEGWSLADGCRETLDTLKSYQIKIGVISNFDTRLPGVLKALKVDDYFDFILTSYEVGIMKPNLEIFKLAEIKANIKSENNNGKQFLHVGDNIELDFLAAQNAGWDAVVISKKKEKLMKLQPMMDHRKIHSSLLEFNEYLKKQ